MTGKKQTARAEGWLLFDRIIEQATAEGYTSPWLPSQREGAARYGPDYETLKRLLGVPLALDADTTTGVPALALDVWTAYELRRAGFEEDLVWPRATAPRILPSTLVQLLQSGTKADNAALMKMLDSGKTYGGAISANANILGKNYVKQVDVVISAWNTGPELLISTKRMDSSVGNNAANRVEESYGDAKNLRNRHPQAALGFLYALRSTALVETHKKALWLIDLLGKLGREDDAYDAVALIIPEFSKATDEPPEAGDDEDRLAAAGLEPEDLLEEEGELQLKLPPNQVQQLDERLNSLPPVALLRDQVPVNLRPETFFATMINRILDNCPITFHEEARRRRDLATSADINFPPPFDAELS